MESITTESFDENYRNITSTDNSKHNGDDCHHLNVELDSSLACASLNKRVCQEQEFTKQYHIKIANTNHALLLMSLSCC